MKLARDFFCIAPLWLAVAFASPLRSAGLENGDVGNPQVKGSVQQVAGGWDMAAGGRDVWGVADEFHFAYQSRTGDFEVIVRLEKLAPAQLYSRAGLMARAALAPGSPHVFFVAFADNQPRHNNAGGFELQFRETEGGKSKAIYPATDQPLPPALLVAYPNVWLRLRRHGNEFTAFAGRDGVHWTVYCTQALNLPATVFVGLALTSHTADLPASASFRDFKDAP